MARVMIVVINWRLLMCILQKGSHLSCLDSHTNPFFNKPQLKQIGKSIYSWLIEDMKCDFFSDGHPASMEKQKLMSWFCVDVVCQKTERDWDKSICVVD